MKRRRYIRTVCDGWTADGSVEGVLATRTYYLRGNRVGRMDFFNRERELFQVQYREVDPPDGPLLQDHWRRHPGVACVLISPQRPTPDGLCVVRTRRYLLGGVLDGQYEIHSDDNGVEIREIELGPDGERVREVRPIYDPSGERVGEKIYDAAGRFLDENREDDW